MRRTPTLGVAVLACALALLAIAPAAQAAKGVVATIGAPTTGTGGGLFNAPRGVAVNTTGNGGVPKGTFYVVDGNNHRIQRFSPTGQFVSAWGWGVATNANQYEICTEAASCRRGKAGAGAGQLGSNGAQGIAIDQSNGVVYVSDQVDRRIDVFSAGGVFEGTFGWAVLTGAAELQFCTSGPSGCLIGSSGANAGQFGGAIGGLAVDASRNLYVADKTNRRVDVFKPIFSGNFVVGVSFTRGFGWKVNKAGPLEEFQTCTTATGCQQGSAGAGLGQFATSNSPSDVAVDSEGNVFAIDNNTTKRVQEFSSAPAPITKEFGSAALAELFGTGELLNIALDTTSAPNHVLVSAKRSASSPANRVAVAELDQTGANFLGAGVVHGSELPVNSGASGTSLGGLAVAPASAAGAIFVSVATTNTLQGAYVLNETVPPTMSPVTVHTGTTATFEGTVSSNEAPVSYHFEYSTDGSSWTKFPEPDASAGAASGTIPVSQAASGLTGSQLYHVRLVASKQTPGGALTSTEVTFTTDPAAPAISGEEVGDRGETSVELKANINPQNQATTYRFEYLTEAAYLANGESFSGPNVPAEAPVPAASAGAGGSPVAISQTLAGLTPDTAYRARLLATNATGTGEGVVLRFGTIPNQDIAQDCPNEAIRQAQHTTYLPDCRAFELVNSPDKGNQHVGFGDSFARTPIAPDGGKLVWGINAGAPEANIGTGASFLAERGDAGWHSRSLIPPAAQQAGNAEFGGYLLEAATPALSSFVFNTGRTALSRGHTLTRLDTEQHETVLRDYPGIGEYPEHAIDFTDDGSHVLSVNTDTPAQLEDYGDGSPEVVSLMPDGNENECGLGFPNEGQFAAQEGISFVGTGNNPHDGVAALWLPGYHLIDTTGASRVYFQALPNADELGSPLSCAERSYALYERIREAPERTILIDPGPGTTEGAPHIARVTPDGRTAYFVTSSNLDPADSNSENDVYRWDEETEESSCLTCVVAEPKLRFKEGGPATILISDDYSHIYFESKAELVPGEGTPGDFNLYALSEGQIRFIADPNSNGFTRGVLERARLSNDGNVLLFEPENSIGASPHFELTSDELAALCKNPNIIALSGCEELFRYDDRDGSLVCVSCQRGGVTTNGAGFGGQSLSPGPSFGGFNGPAYQMSADGSTIAFITAEKLVPRDVNGSADIYEWRNGKVRLLTDGVTSYQEGIAAPEVVAIDTDGSDVFVALDSPGLTGFEQDGLVNLYDARIDGGFDAPSQPAHCSEESCQGPLQGSPRAAGTASSAYAGPGNLSEARPRCARHKVRRNGRCVARRRKHRKRAAGRRAANANRGGVK
jgi:hypothetical protein